MANSDTDGADYRPLFAPPSTTILSQASGGDIVYCWSDDVALAVNVALATNRALLLQGEPGVGKSIVAEAVAKQLNWRFYRHPVSSRTEAQDLTWKLDHVRRLSDAQAGRGLRDDNSYLMPGPFWWAFDPDSARRRGLVDPDFVLDDPGQIEAGRRNDGAVVLIDEIDKADPAVANDLLETVGAARFSVDGLAKPFLVEYAAAGRTSGGGLLMVFTSNNERDMPEAFMRRCIVETMTWPGIDDPIKPEFDRRLTQIAQQNWQRLGFRDPTDPGSPEAAILLTGLVKAIWDQREDHKKRDKRPPGLAEFLDAVAACRELGIVPRSTDDRGAKLWNDLTRLVWSKD